MLLTTTNEGFTVLANDTHISRWVEQERRLDIQDGQISPWFKNLPKDGFAIDVGAFIGDTAASICNYLNVNGRLLCIEPSPDAYQCLIKNIPILKPLAMIKCINAALGATEANATLFTDPNAGASHLVDRLINDAANSVPVLTLDSILATSPQFASRQVHFIKIDVEGWELGVLRGSIETLKAHHPDLLIEINQGALARQGVAPHQIYSLLTSLGYTYRITDPTSCNYYSPQFDIYATIQS
jgi:FkbM family methyltransferase